MENVYLQFSLTPNEWPSIRSMPVPYTIRYPFVYCIWNSLPLPLPLYDLFRLFFQISKLISLLCSLFACPQTGRQTDTKCKQLSSNSHAYADRHHTHHTKPRQFKHISKLTMEGNRVLFIVVVVVTGIRAAITKFFLIISCSFNWKWETLEMENGEK